MTENEIIEQNMGLITKIVKGFKPKSGDEYDRFIQAGRIGIMKAYRAYDEKRAQFSTIAWKYICWSILAEIEENKFLCKELEECAYNIRESLSEYLPKLSIHEKQILDLKIEGYNLREIAKKLDFKYSQIRKLYLDSLKKIQKANENSI